ncbi:F-box protein At5g07610-like [Salvia miltiorrhiza]|uniref:F-box protein At5g07610-like n=1 Tax=Salvia miltiorrhiza TaxID=226208 RepID=UPI0025AB9E11|nr:F-box protein At5g07610-like [Salvia miltiorrhiza]
MNILSRLPIRSIIKSKLVRRAFRDMLDSRDFRLPKSNPRLILSRFPRSTFYRICEINGRDAAPELVVELPIPGTEAAHASVDGLIFIVCKVLPRFIIRNPITREFFKLSAPFGQSYSYDAEKYKFGFGVSGASRRYKVVRICGSECLVYTLGSGRWRAVGVGAVAPPLLRSRCDWFSEPAFLGGNLHWLDSETNVICFDLETEVLTYFSAPPHQHRSKDDRCFRRVSALDDCLCLTELHCGALDDVEIDIWFMRNGRDWSKERVIVWEGHGSYIFHCFPVKVFEDGDVAVGRAYDALLQGGRWRTVSFNSFL